jgi:hypothetical protein
MAMLKGLWITNAFTMSPVNFCLNGHPLLVVLSVEIGEYVEKCIVKRYEIFRLTLKEIPITW